MINSVNILLNNISVSIEKKNSNYEDSLLNSIDINIFSDTAYAKSLFNNADNLVLGNKD